MLTELHGKRHDHLQYVKRQDLSIHSLFIPVGYCAGTIFFADMHLVNHRSLTTFPIFAMPAAIFAKNGYSHEGDSGFGQRVKFCSVKRFIA